VEALGLGDINLQKKTAITVLPAEIAALHSSNAM
jgi:hypothetical protein